jgi:type IV pilus assembly protein PilQ
MRHRIGVLLTAAAFAGLAPAPAVLAQDASQTQSFDNRIEALEVAEQGGAIYVRLTLREPLASPPPSFSVANPARIAFDFPGTANALGRNVQTIDQGDLRSANIVQAGDRTRLVLNLTRMSPYEARVQGRDLIIALSPAAARAVQGTVVSEAAANFAAPRSNAAAAGGLAVRDINFRRGTGGEGRVVVDLSSPEAGIDIRQQGGNLVVDFLKTSLPEHLRRRSDVTDFATPVTSMTAQQVGDRVRLTVTPNGLWEHNAYQSDSRFVLEVKRVVEDPNRLVTGATGKFQGEKLSLNFQNIDVRSVLQVIADFTDINIVTSDAVQGTVTLRLKDVPWDQALEVVLQAKGLSYTKTGDVIWVATIAEIDAQQQAEARRQQLGREIEELKTEVFQINYHDAEEIAVLIRAQEKGGLTTLNAEGAGAARNVPLAASGSGRDTVTRQTVWDTGRVGLLSERGSVTPDKKSNKLFVRDIAASREAIAGFLKQVDTPPRQVLIEARIVEANKDFARDLGVRLGVGDNRTRSLGGIGQIGFGSSTLAPGTNVFNPGLVSTGGLGPISTFSTMNLSLFNNAATRFLNLELSALETDERGRVISSPRVLTGDRYAASIEQGVEIPYQEASSSGATSVSFKKAVMSLRVTPKIAPDGRVQLEIEVNKDRPLFDPAFSVPSIETKNVRSEVLVDNGGTVVIGGIYQETEDNNVARVPVLGELPVVGALFRTRSVVSNRSELLVFITPRIVADQLSVK